jgi:hypothetical protein
MTALHMGSLHAIEMVLVVVLAVGPFAMLAAAIVVARRRDRAELESHNPHRTQQEENSWC